MPNLEFWGAPRRPATLFHEETLFVKIYFLPKKSLISLSLFQYEDVIAGQGRRQGHLWITCLQKACSLKLGQPWLRQAFYCMFTYYIEDIG